MLKDMLPKHGLIETPTALLVAFVAFFVGFLAMTILRRRGAYDSVASLPLSEDQEAEVRHDRA